MYKYFKNLTENIGYNETSSSCGYVALGMLLNYYDTSLNDNIVEEKYEVNTSFENDMYAVTSPGTLHEESYNPTGQDVAGYMNYLRQHYVNSSLHAKLSLLGTDALEENPSILGTFRETFGTNKTIITETIEKYFDCLSNDINYSYEYYILNGDETEKKHIRTVSQINSYIIESIDNGKPVYAGYANHAIIIYGYTNNKFIYQNGYINDSENATVWPTELLDDSKINFVLTLDFNIEEVCSYHYYNITNSNVYCMCGQNYHQHKYIYNYEYYTTNYHKAYCVCDEYILQLHNYREDLRVEEDCPCGSDNPFI